VYDSWHEERDSTHEAHDSFDEEAVMKPLILGASGLSLTPEVAAFFAHHRPCGFILFKRNIDNPEQVRALVDAMRQAAQNPDALVLIDQEGGRVARLRPPHWREYPTCATFGAIHARDAKTGLEAARLGARLIADDLLNLGINVDCLPVLDVPLEGAHDVIGDRAYGRTPAIVTALGRAAAEGLMEGGVLPVIKHIPGHGRAMADSHHDLPIVTASRAELDAQDFPPFAALNAMPLAMTAHVIFTAIDAQNPATTSQIVIRDIIRGQMGYDGLLMSDDLSMKALSGSFAERRAQSLAAGCDVVLHCNGDMAEMTAIAEGCPEMGAEAHRRFTAALHRLNHPRPAFDRGKAEARFAELLAHGA
jgi:beta-N-acetylhexosaminidase